MLRTITTLGLVSLFSFSYVAVAETYPLPTKTRYLERTGVYMETTGTVVPNPKNTPCNSIVSCRASGQNLAKISTFETASASMSEGDYPKKAEYRRRERSADYWRGQEGSSHAKVGMSEGDYPKKAEYRRRERSVEYRQDGATINTVHKSVISEGDYPKKAEYRRREYSAAFWNNR